MTAPDVHATGTGDRWTLCGLLIRHWAWWESGTVSGSDVRVHADGGGVTCPNCLEALR